MTHVGENGAFSGDTKWTRAEIPYPVNIKLSKTRIAMSGHVLIILTHVDSSFSVTDYVNFSSLQIEDPSASRDSLHIFFVFILITLRLVYKQPSFKIYISYVLHIFVLKKPTTITPTPHHQPQFALTMKPVDGYSVLFERELTVELRPGDEPAVPEVLRVQLLTKVTWGGGGFELMGNLMTLPLYSSFHTHKPTCLDSLVNFS